MKSQTPIQKKLFSLQDNTYKLFQQKLIPTIPAETIIGVRTPALRSLAKELAGTSEAEQLLAALPHAYFEENQLHAFIIETIKDFEAALAATEAFLPYIDNWATCDQLTPKAFKKNLPALYAKIKVWIASDKPYTVRFGIGMLLNFFLDEHFTLDSAKRVARVRSSEYYVNMMIAWYFATALAKQYDAVLPFIEQHKLDVWTHNKTIQKACESYRISREQKTYVRTLKR
ncbi:MAG: DNA alkylation repair protein [Treponema sp.]|nr:DNA alkylation repair protein [Treponema sp.]